MTNRIRPTLGTDMGEARATAEDEAVDDDACGDAPAVATELELDGDPDWSDGAALQAENRIANADTAHPQLRTIATISR